MPNRLVTWGFLLVICSDFGVTLTVFEFTCMQHMGECRPTLSGNFGVGANALPA
jgi:hypothetical protein